MNSQLIMMKELAKNENSQIIKQAVRGAALTVEERVYWLTTAQMQGDFLQQYWDKQVIATDVMKKRIAKITQQKFNQLFSQVDKGKVTSSSDLEVYAIGNLNLSALAEQIPIYDPKYFSINHPKTLETKEKLKQIKQDHQKFKEKVQEIKKKEEERRREKAAIDEQIRQSLEKQKRQRYREKALKTIQEKEHKKQERMKEQQKFKEFLRAYKSSKPLHVLMEQQYKEKIELPILEENKKKLQQYLQYQHKIKPTLQEINQHEKSYLEAKEGRESRIVVANQTIDVFKSKFYLDEEKKMREAEEGYETLFDHLEKKKRYSELVKETYKPKISMKLRNSIAQTQMKSSTARQSLDRTNQYQKGKQYLEFMRSLQKNRKQHSSPSERAEDDQQKHRYVNYLETLKQSRQIKGQSKQAYDWEKDMRNSSISQIEKRERILMKSKQLEQKAQMKQQFVNNNFYGRAQQLIERKKQIDQTLISSIRAKVAVLRDIHET